MYGRMCKQASSLCYYMLIRSMSRTYIGHDHGKSYSMFDRQTRCVTNGIKLNTWHPKQGHALLNRCYPSQLSFCHHLPAVLDLSDAVTAFTRRRPSVGLRCQWRLKWWRCCKEEAMPSQRRLSFIFDDDGETQRWVARSIAVTLSRRFTLLHLAVF